MSLKSDSIFRALQNGEKTLEWQKLLSKNFEVFDCSSGTIHVMDKSNDSLRFLFISQVSTWRSLIDNQRIDSAEKRNSPAKVVGKNSLSEG